MRWIRGCPEKTRSRLECWSIGVLECWNKVFIAPLLHSSIPPLLLLVLVTSGCARAPSSDVLVVGLSQTVETLDPAMHRDRTTETVIRNLMDGLLTRDADMRVVPELAESVQAVNDTTWEIKLRRGVRFHNGDPLTARDVKFTLERTLKPKMIDGGSSPRAGLLGPVTDVERVDDYTLRVRTKVPFPILPALLPFHEIVPEGYVQRVGARRFAEQPIGTGPFKFVEWARGERVVMERFGDYYGGSPNIPPAGPAVVRLLVFKFIPEPASRVAALKSGDCHIIQDLPPHLVANVQADPRTKVLSCKGTRTYYIGLNVTQPPFDDVCVRWAMNHAVNFPAIVDTVLAGRGERLAGPLVPETFGFDKSLRPYAYDPQRAKQLLAEAGYPKGFAVEFDVEKDFQEVAQAVSGQLRRVGVEARVRVWEWGVLQPQLPAGKRKMFFTHWGNATLDPIDILTPTLHSGERGNYTGYGNREVDGLLDKANVTMEANERRRLFERAQRLIHSDAPWVFGYRMDELYGARREVEGWQPSADGRLNMHDTMLVVGNGLRAVPAKPKFTASSP